MRGINSIDSIHSMLIDWLIDDHTGINSFFSKNIRTYRIYVSKCPEFMLFLSLFIAVRIKVVSTRTHFYAVTIRRKRQSTYKNSPINASPPIPLPHLVRGTFWFSYNEPALKKESNQYWRNASSISTGNVVSVFWRKRTLVLLPLHTESNSYQRTKTTCLCWMLSLCWIAFER